MEPFPKAVGNKKYLLICTDYFTKWVKTETLANIRDVDVKGSSGRTLLLDSGFPMLSSRIMAFNLIVKPSGNTVLI